MGAAEKRNEHRIDPSLRFTPVSCILISEDQRIPVEIVNYHYRGACLKFQVNDYRIQQKNSFLKFKIGNQEVNEKIIFRIVWESISENGLCGIEFNSESSFVLSRSERFLVNSINAPVVSSQDPLDPNRIIYFKVVNASTTGMLLITSLSNKHLFPGMELRTAILSIPGIGKTDLELFIENSRPGMDDSVLFGVSVKGTSHNYHDLISRYLSSFGKTSDGSDRLEKLHKAGLLTKKLKHNLTIKEIKTEEEYKEVLKLRLSGYTKAGKTKSASDYTAMGDGLKDEGLIIAAYLGGQIVASVELRFSAIHKLRLSKRFNFKAHQYLSSNEFVEINKLVVAPYAQRTDIVVGMFQKIHALTMLNGRPDGLLVAEDSLVSLYQRLGAKKVGLDFPHSTKNTTLHVMCIPRSTYEGASEINPLAWTQIYSATQEFLFNAGLAPKREFTAWEKILLAASKSAISLKGKLKKKKREETTFTEVLTDKPDSKVRSVIDPKWTLQHLHASVLLPYLLVSDELIGSEKTNKILFQYNIKRDYFYSAGNWISIEFFDQFISDFKKHGNLDQLQKLAGYKNLSREVLGVNHFLLKHFLSPKEAFKAFGTYLPRFNKTRTYEVIDSSPTHCRIRIGIVDRTLVPKDPSAKLNWLSILDGHVLVITGKHGDIIQSKSVFDGDDYCEYLIRWENPLFSTRSILILTAAVGLSSYGAKLAFEKFSFEQVLTFAGFTVLSMLSLFFATLSSNRKSKYYEMVESLERFQRDSDERYKELQSSKSLIEKTYLEGKLLESISREIQTSDELNQILNRSLESLCTNFDIQRAFIMTIDENGKCLRTSSMYGAGDSSEDLWNFKVEVSVRRENPLVLSSVFHSGQSILITNTDEHKFHLNEASRRLIEKLNTTAFAIVPIPSGDKNWGVLIADKGQNRNLITRRDLVALQRVAQSIGIALDKKSKLEAEIRTRKIFQKYVPSVVVESTLGEKEPKLGGHARDAICLFMDIRNFTKLSSQIPPEILVEVLNEIFDLLQKSVSKSNGVIDKFLGDGALVTWGSTPGSEVDPDKVISATHEFLSNLDQMNSKFVSKGLAPIEVGIGIHKGKVIAGNIGSTDRMEFTVIGSAVNLASRLEQLTKVYKCHVIISEQVLDFSSLPAHWQIYQDVQVRGLTELIKIATLEWTTRKPKAEDV